MNDTLKEFLEKFKKIAQKGFIKSSSNDWGAIGKTFEKEMGKLPDSSYNPDYKDIEIKCSSRYSRYPLYLFTISFDGPGENEIERITNRYGFYDHDFPDKKVLFRRISKDFNTFLSLIRKDKLDINLISRINKSSIDAEKIKIKIL